MADDDNPGSTYSEEFELSLSPTSSVFYSEYDDTREEDTLSVTRDENEHGNEEERGAQERLTGEEPANLFFTKEPTRKESMGPRSTMKEEDIERTGNRGNQGNQGIEEIMKVVVSSDHERNADGTSEHAGIGGPSSQNGEVGTSEKANSPPDPAAEKVGGDPLLIAVTLPSSVDCERDGRTAKQKHLDLKRKVAIVWEEADALAHRRDAEDLRVRQQAQQTKESWHLRIHRRHTDIDWYRMVAAKTAQAVVDTTLHREAWRSGVACARTRLAGRDAAFLSVIKAIRVYSSEKEKRIKAIERERADKEAAGSNTVWEAARYSVPVQRLQELMEQKMEKSRYIKPSESFEQLCRRVEGIVVESRHPYTKGVRQEVEACVPGADFFYIAFDAASNAATGKGKVSLQELNARDPAVFSIRGPYCAEPSGEPFGEARLPGVDAEPPMRVEGSSVLVLFSASYWRGAAPAGEDYGWRLVCFTAPTDEKAQALVTEAERAADRVEAVDAVNIFGETCLHVACFEGNVAAARYLLSLDADPNSAHTVGGLNTPLHEAVSGGSLASVLLLLKSSANVLASNSHGDLPLHVACRAGRMDIARRLILHDSDWSTVVACNHAGLRPSHVVHGCAALTSLLEKMDTTAEVSACVESQGRKTLDHHSKNEKGFDWESPRKRKGSRGVDGAGALLTGGMLPRLARLPRPLSRVKATEEVEMQSIAGWSGSSASYGASLTESDFAIPEVSPVANVSLKGRRDIKAN